MDKVFRWLVCYRVPVDPAILLILMFFGRLFFPSQVQMSNFITELLGCLAGDKIHYSQQDKGENHEVRAHC